MWCVIVLQRGHSGDGCDLASTLRGGGVRSILLLSLVARRLETIDVCFYVCCCDCVGVCGNVCCVAAIVKIVFSPWSVEVCCMFV